MRSFKNGTISRVWYCAVQRQVVEGQADGEADDDLPAHLVAGPAGRDASGATIFR